MHFILKTGKQEPACQHFHHEVHEEKKGWTLNTITIGKQFINCIGRKATHPQTFTILSLRGAQATRQSSPNRPTPQASPATLHTHHLSPTPQCHCEPQSGAAIQRNRYSLRQLPALPLDCRVGSRKDPPRNDIGISGIEESLRTYLKQREGLREAFLIPACELPQLPRDARVRPKWHPPPLRDRQGNRSGLRACTVP